MTRVPFQIVLRDEADVFFFVRSHSCTGNAARRLGRALAKGGRSVLSLAHESFLKALKREFS